MFSPDAIKKRPYAVPRPVLAVTASNSPVKAFATKPQETQEQHLARATTAKFLTPTPRRKPFSFFPKKDVPDQATPKSKAVRERLYAVPRPTNGPYAIARPVPAVAVSNSPVKAFDTKPQETQEHRLARAAAAKFLTPTPRRKLFSFSMKKEE